MGAHILLLNPNRCEEPYPVYPVGLAYVARTLTEAGHAVSFWDALMSGETLAATIAATRPEVVAISVRNIDNVQSQHAQWFVADLIALCADLRALTDAPIVLGGSGFGLFPEALLEVTGADFGLIGEAEESVVELVAAIGRGETPSGLPGLVWREGEAVRVNPGPTCAHFETRVPLHSEPLLQAYLRAGSPIGIQSQRGCVLRCCYCTYPVIEGRCMRHRQPEAIVAEVEELVAAGVPYIFFVDSVFNVVPDHARGVCEAFARRGLQLPWGAFLRPSRIDEEQAALFSRAGMKHAEFGSDSLNDEVLWAYRKSFNFEEIERSHAVVSATGIHCSHFIIAGGPGETAATLEDTLEKSRRLAQAVFFAMVGMRVYPGTTLWDEHVRSGGQKDPRAYLEPVFHLAPGLTSEGILARLNAHAASHPSWIVGDPPKAFKVATEKLRARGQVGPLWEYIELLQRFMVQR